LGDCHIGDSIAVNGACLTVTEFDKDQNGGWFKVWLANETLDRTNLGASGLGTPSRHQSVQGSLLGECKVGDRVNLERAMGAHVRFGGHFVQVRLRLTILG
jgi:riboflavin synthase